MACATPCRVPELGAQRGAIQPHSPCGTGRRGVLGLSDRLGDFVGEVVTLLGHPQPAQTRTRGRLQGCGRSRRETVYAARDAGELCAVARRPALLEAPPEVRA